MPKRLLLLIFFYLVLEGVCFLGLFFLQNVRGIHYQPVSKTHLTEEERQIVKKLVEGKNQYFAHSPSLGWTIQPQGTFEIYKANSQGIRAEKDYESAPVAGVTRIAAFGDSFTHSDEVAFSDSWPQKLSSLNPDLEVLNFGVSGYGLDQAFLRFEKEGKQFHPKVVLICFLSENIARNVNVFRPFYGDTHFPFAKPRFLLTKEEISLQPNPLSRLEDYTELLKNEKVILRKLSPKEEGVKSQLRNLNKETGK